MPIKSIKKETEEVLQLAKKIASFIRNESLNEKGLFRTEEFDVERVIWFNDKCDADDFGDFAPFLVWYDLLVGNRKNEFWVKKQVELMKKKLRQSSGFYYPFSDGSGFKSIVSYPQNHIDLIVGFDLLFRLTKEQEYYRENKALLDTLIKYAITEKGFVYGSVIPRLHLYYPAYGYIRHKPEVSGIFIEEMANFYAICKERGREAYLENAMKMLKAWSSLKSFKTDGLFADQVWPFLNIEASRKATIGKMNTNMLCGILRLYEVSKDVYIKGVAIKHIEGMKKFIKNNVFCSVYDVKKRRIADATVNKVKNHMAMGAFLDAYSVLKNKEYLRIVERCASFWSKGMKDGLFMEASGKEKNKCSLDGQADMLVIFCRLYMITKNKEYLDVIKEGLKGLKKFESTYSMYNIIDFDTKRAISINNELKFLGGALKGLLSCYTILSKTKKADSTTIELLMRDR